jgi:quercetin dioxygenase-like cupin family protein
MDTFDAYMARVADGTQATGGMVPMGTGFVDRRGSIMNLAHVPMASGAIIKSAARTVRANHYHKTDWHLTYVLSGQVIYFEREVGSTEIKAPELYTPGATFFSPPMREHAMLFPCDTTIITFARNVRTHENHESDVVRVDYITPEEVNKWLP